MNDNKALEGIGILAKMAQKYNGPQNPPSKPIAVPSVAPKLARRLKMTDSPKRVPDLKRTGKITDFMQALAQQSLPIGPDLRVAEKPTSLPDVITLSPGSSGISPLKTESLQEKIVSTPIGTKRCRPAKNPAIRKAATGAARAR